MNRKFRCTLNIHRLLISATILLIATVIIVLCVVLSVTSSPGEMTPTPTPITIIKHAATPEPIVVLKSEKKYKSLDLPTYATGSFKTYMDFRTITDRTSKQYHLQQVSHTDVDGFRRFNDYYLVAVGSYYSNYQIGKELKIILEDETIINALIGDLKQDIHTDVKNQHIVHNGNIVEFIVDVNILDCKSRDWGDVSHSGFEGRIVAIKEVM